MQPSLWTRGTVISYFMQRLREIYVFSNFTSRTQQDVTPPYPRQMSPNRSNNELITHTANAATYLPKWMWTGHAPTQSKLK